MKKTARIPTTHEPLFGGNEWRYVKECLDTGWVSSAGRFVDLFEQETARRLGAAHAVAIVNGTSALQLSMEVAGVRPGDEILMPSLTFIATATAAVHLGAVPHFIDVEPATMGLDPEALGSFLKRSALRRGGKLINRATGRRLAACVPMHTLGHPVLLESLLAVCARYELPVIEDAAESLGSLYRGRPTGTFGQLGVLSFNGNKIVTSGGGGMILTDDAALAERAKHLSTQAKSDAAAFWHDAAGYNYRLPNINAALGLAQLEQLDAFIEKKRRIAGWYREFCDGNRGLRVVWEPEGCRSNFWLNTLRADRPARAAALLSTLNRKGLAARPLWAPCHRQPPLKSYPAQDMRVTDELWRTCVNVPSSAALARADIKAVAEAAVQA